MLKRYQEGGLKSVTAFRLVKQYINNARDANKKREISKRLRKFAESSHVSIDYLQIESASAAAEVSAMGEQISKLVEDLRELDVERCIGEEKLWKALESLLTLIRKKLRDAGRRLTK